VLPDTEKAVVHFCGSYQASISPTQGEPNFGRFHRIINPYPEDKVAASKDYSGVCKDPPVSTG
jgi:hypothetical protein